MTDSRTLIQRFADWLYLGAKGIPDGDAAECGYGKNVGAQSNCSIVVAPYDGYRDSGEVFCSPEHAKLDQEEQAI